MDNKKRSGPSPQSSAIIKVVSRNVGNGRQGSPPITFWAKWRGKVVYGWHLYRPTPHWQSPRWLATGGALLLVWLAVAATFAHSTEPALRWQAARAQTASAGNGTAELRSGLVTAVDPAIYATASTIYIVQPNDTLYRIASRYNTTLEALDQINQLNSAISVGQVLVIPPADFGVAGTAVPTDQFACAQFSFQQAGQSARAGVFALHDLSGGQIAAWSAPQGATNSGWIYDLPVAFASVHARVLFYPRYGGGTAVEMSILNHAPDTAAGWLTRGLCHSLELAYSHEN